MGHFGIFQIHKKIVFFPGCRFPISVHFFSNITSEKSHIYEVFLSFEHLQTNYFITKELSVVRGKHSDTFYWTTENP